MSKFADYIKRNNVNISKMAREINYSRNTIYRAMRGLPSSGEFVLVCGDYFGEDPRRLFDCHHVQHVKRNQATSRGGSK